ncbi:MAG: fluoride efflux transporter CrcB [Nonlabens sp.]
MIKQLALVFLGGGLGCALRFYFSIFVNSEQLKWLPTLSVNLLGCFALGLLFGLYDKEGLPLHWYLIFGTGFCGGLTTFSTFSLELMSLLKTSDFAGTTIYLIISILGGVICAFLGYWLTRFL